MARIKMKSARPYFPTFPESEGNRTRPVNQDYYNERVKCGCPHCATTLSPGFNPRGGRYHYCDNNDCSFAVDTRYYYVSNKNETIPQY